MLNVLPALLKDGGVYIKKMDVFGKLIYANDLYYKTFGYKEIDIIGEPFNKFIIEENKTLAWDMAKLALEKIGKPVFLNYELYNVNTCKNEATQWQYLGVSNKSGKIFEVNCFGVHADEKTQIKEVLKLRQQTDYFFNVSPKPMLIINKKKEIVKLNESFADFSKQYPCFLIGKKILDILHISNKNLIDILENKRSFKALTGTSVYFDEVVGREIRIEIYNADGCSFLIFNDAQSYTEQKGLINKYEKILRDIELNANVGWWSFNVKEKKWSTSKNAHQIFGFRGFEQDNFKAFLKLLNYSQKRIFLKGVKENLNGRPTNGNFVINTSDGIQKTIKINGSSEVEQNEVVRIKGTVQDVTDSKYKERLLRNVMNKTFHDIIVVDKSFKIIFFNERAASGILNIFGENNFLGQHFFDVFASASAVKIKTLLKLLENTDVQIAEESIIINGVSYFYEIAVSVFKDVSNTLSAYVIKMRNIDEKQKVAAKLENTSFNFSKAQKIAQISTFEYDYKKDEFSFEDDLVKMIPFFNSNTLKFRDFEKYISPKDFKCIKDTLSHISEFNVTKEMEVYVDLGFLKMNLFGKAFPVEDEFGHVVKAKGILQNITERRKNEALLESIINSSTYDVIVLDKDYNIVKYNNGYANSLVLKLPFMPEIGKNIFDFISKGQVDIVKNSFLEAFKGNPNEFELDVVLINKVRQYSRIYTFPIMETNGAIEKIVTNIFNYEEEKKLQDKLLNMKLAKERNVSKLVVEALENERIVLGSELHDNVNQILGMSKLTIEYFIENANAATSILSTTKDYISEAIEEIRRISYNLSPPNLEDIGLKESLKLLINKLNVANKFNMKFHYSITDEILPKNYELGIYRVIQEGLNNIIKHAEPTEVNIEVMEVGKHAIVLINDNGKGFTIDLNNKGAGLKNMRYRTEAINGNFYIESKINLGTTIIIKIPF